MTYNMFMGTLNPTNSLPVPAGNFFAHDQPQLCPLYNILQQ